MGLSRCHSLMKCLLILFNVVFLVLGIGVCALCLWAFWEGRAGETGAGRAGLGAAAGWGAALGAGAITGLAGAAHGSPAPLAASFALLLLAAVGETAAGCWGYARLPRLRAALHERFHNSVKDDYAVSHSTQQIVDSIQQGLQCCGANSPREWQGSSWGQHDPLSAPPAPDSPQQAPASAPAAAPRAALDLSVSAPAPYYWVPASCCVNTIDATECEISRRIPAASGGAPGIYAAGCGPLIWDTLVAYSRLPFIISGVLLAIHAITLLLTLALCLRVRPPQHYKA